MGLTFAGCAQPQAEQYVSVRQVRLADPATDPDRLWNAAEESLRRHHFQLDRVDPRHGVITTIPEMSQHYFEIWRRDVKTAHDFWEATLNPIRRWVEVSVSHEAEPRVGKVAVIVHKERLSSLDRQFNSTGAAYQYFGDRLPSTTGLVSVTEEDDQWLDIGRDPAMEDYLLRAILARVDLPEL